MEKSKVYFTDFRTVLGVSLTAKLQKLIRMAGIGNVDMNGKFVAIKMHFGESMITEMCGITAIPTFPGPRHLNMPKR